jgi:hypothetical protein
MSKVKEFGLMLEGPLARDYVRYAKLAQDLGSGPSGFLRTSNPNPKSSMMRSSQHEPTFSEQRNTTPIPHTVLSVGGG